MQQSSLHFSRADPEEHPEEHPEWALKDRENGNHRIDVTKKKD